MELVAYTDPEAFGRAIDPLVARHPVVLNHMRTSLWAGETVQAWVGGTADAAAVVLGASTFVSPLDPAVASAFAEVIAPTGGVLRGAPVAASAVAGFWSEIHGGGYEPAEMLRIYRLGDIAAPAVSGAARPARTDEFDHLFEWACDMTDEIEERPDRDAFRPRVLRRHDLGQFWFWEVEGNRVAQLFRSRDAHGVVRIGGVYTPPAHRGNGYAAALTAQVSQQLQSAGLTVTLNTQAHNPLSNRVYRRIGFEAVGELMGLRLFR